MEEEEGEGSKQEREQGRGERVRERGTCLRAKVGKIERYNLYLSYYVAGNITEITIPPPNSSSCIYSACGLKK